MENDNQKTLAKVLQPDRLAELEATGLLDSSVEETFDRFTRLASTILKTPVSLVSLVDRERQFFKSSIGLQEPWASSRETPLSHSFCQHVVETSEPLCIVDTRLHPLFKEHLGTIELGVVAYLGVPITTAKGHTLGSFCAIDTKPREWTPEELATLSDLTALLIGQVEFRLLAQQLHAEYLELRNLELFRTETVEMLVHDLRDPLDSLLGGLDLTQKYGGLTETQNHYVDLAKNGGKVLLQMINSILDTRTAQSQLMELNKIEVDPERIIAEACKQMLPLAKKSEVSLKWYTQGELSCIADADKLRRVIVNLVGNAIQHTLQGGEVSVFAHTDRGNAVLFSVADTGDGIPKAAFGQIFVRGASPREKRVERVKTNWAKGASTGLNLPFSQMAISAHGGRIWVESEIGQGTTFYFTIPLL
ncbi:GAF domain-containing sensor histidine kinase [Chamaesiphon sp. OTE_20_metabat_361]|uniref:GAF domain-containing sensor histidine kinase n=1 Tax=Chamaesiphon sp. OTE_20_metabat_361 TaxID=2964689 RepID=UPI002869F2B2|nr:GAF domain-containing sensor histidine kinase [Chamaesiphon sp. OTE_20_metabat_361]